MKGFTHPTTSRVTTGRNLLIFLFLLVSVRPASFASGEESIPRRLSHQGIVTVSGSPYEGTGLFRFAIVDTEGLNLWTNDGSRVLEANEPDTPVSLSVTAGLYAVLLGDDTMPGMVAIAPDVFDNVRVFLRVWFDDGVNGSQQLAPDQPLTSTPYALRALHAENGTVTGQLVMWAGSEGTVPSGWLLCDGSPVSRYEYTELFAVIGTTYGAGDGSTTFNLPDMRQRFPLGMAASSTGSTLGAKGGTIDHSHAVPRHEHIYTDVVAHPHVIDPPSTTSGAQSASHYHSANPPSTSTSTGGSHAHSLSGAEWSSAKDAYWGSGTGTGQHYWSPQGWGDTLAAASGGSHNHTVDIAAFNTGNQSASHTHAVDITAFTSDSTGDSFGTTEPSEEEQTETSNPPFLVLNFIIKD